MATGRLQAVCYRCRQGFCSLCRACQPMAKFQKHLADKGPLCGAGNVQLNGKKLNMIVSEVRQLRHLTLLETFKDNLLETGTSRCNLATFCHHLPVEFLRDFRYVPAVKVVDKASWDTFAVPHVKPSCTSNAKGFRLRVALWNFVCFRTSLHRLHIAVHRRLLILIRIFIFSNAQLKLCSEMGESTVVQRSENWHHKDLLFEIGDGIAYLTLNRPRTSKNIQEL
jgi:hypothetical protein